MSGFIGYRDGGKTNEEGLMKFLRAMLSGGVPTGFLSTSLQASQRGAGANMSVDLAIGDAWLVLPSNAYGYWGWFDAIVNQAIATADPSNPRIDAVYVWIDLSVISSTSNNNVGAFKTGVLAGTPAGSPVAPTNSAIQTALGAGVPFARIANVAVGAAVSSIVNANITDVRSAITSLAAAGPNTVADSAIVGMGSQKLSNPYKFRVYKNTSGNATNTNTAIPFDTKSFDTGSNVDITTNKGRFTAAIAGFYQFNAGFVLASGGTLTGRIFLFKNGVQITPGLDSTPLATSNVGCNVSDELQLAANDYVEAYGFASATSGFVVSSGSQPFFSGFLVSAT